MDVIATAIGNVDNKYLNPFLCFFGGSSFSKFACEASNDAKAVCDGMLR